jgi:hypothetical protein
MLVIDSVRRIVRPTLIYNIKHNLNDLMDPVAILCTLQTTVERGSVLVTQWRSIRVQAPCRQTRCFACCLLYGGLLLICGFSDEHSISLFAVLATLSNKHLSLSGHQLFSGSMFCLTD